MYNTNTDESYYFKFYFDLLFLDSNNVIDCFTDEFLAILPAKDDRVVQFTYYVFENYISPDAMGPPNSSFYSSHPNIYNSIDMLV
jgi:hypothetical protein